MLKKILIGNLFFIMMLCLNTTWARSPAVLPTIGISIDHVKSPPPDKMKNPGFEFSKNTQPQVLIENKDNQVTYQFAQQVALTEKEQKRRTNISVRTLPLAMTLIIISFPLIAWLYLNQKNEDEEYLPAIMDQGLENTVSLAERRERLEEEQNRKNYIQGKLQDQTQTTEEDKISKKAS